ncbi:hypothetical protein ACWCXH_33080 [Kitasatospora sp. NPDC001660]
MSGKSELKSFLGAAGCGAVTLVVLFFALPFVGWMMVGPDSPDDPVDRYDVKAADLRDDGENFLRQTTAAIGPGLVFHDSGYQIQRDEPRQHGKQSPSSHVHRTLKTRTVVLVGHEAELERRITDAWLRMRCPLTTVDTIPESGIAGADRILRTTDPNGLRAELSLQESRMNEPGPRTVRATITISQDSVQYAPDEYGDLAADHVPGSRPGDPADATVDDPYWSH